VCVAIGSVEEKEVDAFEENHKDLRISGPPAGIRNGDLLSRGIQHIVTFYFAASRRFLHMSVEVPSIKSHYDLH
jgi:hypothetical protein